MCPDSRICTDCRTNMRARTPIRPSYPLRHHCRIPQQTRLSRPSSRSSTPDSASERKRGPPLSTSPQSAVYEGDSPSTPAWKEEVNARLVAHRTRRTRNLDNQPALPGLESAALRSETASAAGVAARVAERYSRVPSYREMLAAEVARDAEAAAKATREAHDTAQAVTDDLWSGFD